MNKKQDQEFKQDIFKLTVEGRDSLRVALVSADQMEFFVKFEALNYAQTVRDVCEVAPAIMQRDADLMEAADDAGRTQPDVIDLLKIRRFYQKYAGRINDPINVFEGLDFHRS